MTVKKQEQEFKLGDLVQLKSGGPKMTVNSKYDDTYYCVWFSGTKNNKAQFSFDALQPYVDPEPKK